MNAFWQARGDVWSACRQECHNHLKDIQNEESRIANRLDAPAFLPSRFWSGRMQYGLKHITVLAEDDKVRVLRYAPHKGDKTPIHSHPSAVVYVLKGGRVKYTMPDGSTKISELKAGEALIRPPVTHSDEALDDVETILIEIKQ
jgi:beta-alanine degradation protein BauB